MGKNLIIIAVVLLLGSWFVIGENKSVAEKFAIILAALAVYVGYMLMTGASFEDILAPLMK